MAQKILARGKKRRIKIKRFVAISFKVAVTIVRVDLNDTIDGAEEAV